MTKLNELAAFVCGASAGSLPEAERATQKRHFIDTVVGAVAGLRCRETVELKALFGNSLDERMAHLAAAIRMTEIDDIHMPSCTTPSAVTVPVACAMALAGKTSAATVADAIWVGTELLARLGTAVDGPSILYREVWPTYLAAPLAAAATAARMLGLNEAKTVSALSIALTLTAGGSGRFRQDLSPRWFLHGMGVRSGYLAAKAAEAGYVGDAGLLDRDWLQHSHGVALDINRLFEGLGKGRSIYSELSMKPFSSAKQAVAAIEALRLIVADGVAPESIRAVTVRVPKAYVGMIEGAGDSKNRATTFASVRFQMALALFHPNSLFDVARDKLPWDERMAAFVGKVKVEAADELAAHYPAHWPASVVVEAEGTSVTRTVIDALGDPASPLSEAALTDKAHRVLDPMVGADACKGWLDAAAAGWDKGSHDPKAALLGELLRPV